MQARRTNYVLSDPYLKSHHRTRLSVVKNSTSHFHHKNISKKMLVSIGALSCLTLSFLFLTWIRVGQLEAGYAIARLESEEISLNEQSRALQLEIAVLKRPERIRRIATKTLNLKAPAPHQIIRLRNPLSTNNELASK